VRVRVRVPIPRTSEYRDARPWHARLTCRSEQADAAAKARRSVRTNNFTQQTNALDVDKHMYARPCHFFTFIFGRVLYADRAAFQDGVH
jgi:hypothetical protein